MTETRPQRRTAFGDRNDTIKVKATYLNRAARLRIVPCAAVSIRNRDQSREAVLSGRSAVGPIQPNFVTLTLTVAADWLLEQSR
jgi:hypothetical protein